MFISELKGRVPLFQLARWQMIAAFAMTSIASIAIGRWPSVQAWQFGMLAASSLTGIALASTTYFAAIYAVGPRITALLFSLTSPFALGLGYAPGHRRDGAGQPLANMRAIALHPGTQ